MPSTDVGPYFERFMATAEAVAEARPEVDLEMAREVFREAAVLVHNGLVLDDLDEHDAGLVVEGLCEGLVTPDPGAALRARAQAALDAPEEAHDAEAVWAAYLTTVALFRL